VIFYEEKSQFQDRAVLILQKGKGEREMKKTIYLAFIFMLCGGIVGGLIAEGQLGVRLPEKSPQSYLILPVTAP
jgi:hypothetical protein